MKEVKIKFVADTGQAEKGINDVTDSTKKLDKEVGDVNESTNQLTGSLDKMTGGAVSGFKNFAGGLKKVILGFKTLKGAIAATGIGLLIIAIGAVTSAFTSSEEGQNKFAKAMNVIGTITNVLIDRLASLGSLIIDIFTKPKEVLKDFAGAVKQYVTDQITLITDGLGLLGSAIKKAFSGDFSGALEDAAEGANKLLVQTNPLVQATKALAGATKDLVVEMTEEARIAGVISDQRAAADKLDRQIIVDRAIANRERAKLLEQAIDKEKFSVKERIEFLKEAGRIEEEITQKEIAAAKLRLDAKITENALGGSTKDDLNEEAELRANLINLETAKLTKAKEVTSQILALNAEEKAARDLITAEQKVKDDQKILDEEARIKKEQELLDSRLKGLRDRAAQELAEKKAVEQAKQDMEDATINHTKAGIGILSSLAGENKALQATALIADNAVSIAETVMSAAKSIAQRKAAFAAIPAFIGSFPNPAKLADLPLTIKDIASTKLSAGIGVATSGIALAKGLAALGKGGGGGAGGAQLGGGADAGATAPAFNLVEGTESNAIQDSITGQDNAVKAIVVSGDVTTAQSADRNAVDSSGF
jgi:hypothetical protein